MSTFARYLSLPAGPLLCLLFWKVAVFAMGELLAILGLLLGGGGLVGWVKGRAEATKARAEAAALAARAETDVELAKDRLMMEMQQSATEWITRQSAGINEIRQQFVDLQTKTNELAAENNKTAALMNQAVAQANESNAQASAALKQTDAAQKENLELLAKIEGQAETITEKEIMLAAVIKENMKYSTTIEAMRDMQREATQTIMVVPALPEPQEEEGKPDAS